MSASHMKAFNISHRLLLFPWHCWYFSSSPAFRPAGFSNRRPIALYHIRLSFSGRSFWLSSLIFALASSQSFPTLDWMNTQGMIMLTMTSTLQLSKNKTIHNLQLSIYIHIYILIYMPRCPHESAICRSRSEGRHLQFVAISKDDGGHCIYDQIENLALTALCAPSWRRGKWFWLQKSVATNKNRQEFRTRICKSLTWSKAHSQSIGSVATSSIRNET